MGSSQSSLPQSDDEDEDDDRRSQPTAPAIPTRGPHPKKEQVLEQEPEILPCYASASPLSAVGTPRGVGGTHIKVWDPCHVIIPPRVLGLVGPGPGPGPDPATAVEVLLVSHGESAASLRPDLVTGRWPAAGLTGNGERQARALAVMLKSQGVRFEKVFSSPLDRAMATARLVCRELGFATEQIESSSELVEMSHGQWEGCLRSEIYTQEMLSVIDRTQPDFSAPSGESLRQVEFRMIEFLNRTALKMPEKPIDAPITRDESNWSFSRQSSTNSVQERDGGPQWDLVYRLSRPGLQRKKSGKSRLQVVTTGDNEADDEFLQRELREGPGSSTASIGIFTHSTPIKCLLAGVLGANPAVSQKFWIDDSSVTVLRHSMRMGWQIKRINDTSHLRLL